MQLKVECYSGYKADERPIRFRMGDRVYQVIDILDRWYGPKDAYFRVLADDGNVYVLRHRQWGAEDYWSLEAFRALNHGFKTG